LKLNNLNKLIENDLIINKKIEERINIFKKSLSNWELNNESHEIMYKHYEKVINRIFEASNINIDEENNNQLLSEIMSICSLFEHISHEKYNNIQSILEGLTLLHQIVNLYNIKDHNKLRVFVFETYRAYLKNNLHNNAIINRYNVIYSIQNWDKILEFINQSKKVFELKHNKTKLLFLSTVKTRYNDSLNTNDILLFEERIDNIFKHLSLYELVRLQYLSAETNSFVTDYINNLKNIKNKVQEQDKNGIEESLLSNSSNLSIHNIFKMINEKMNLLEVDIQNLNKLEQIDNQELNSNEVNDYKDIHDEIFSSNSEDNKVN